MPAPILSLAAAIALMLPASAAAMDERDYWAFADRMQQRVDELRVVTIPDAGHFVPWERPEPVASAR